GTTADMRYARTPRTLRCTTSATRSTAACTSVRATSSTPSPPAARPTTSDLGASGSPVAHERHRALVDAALADEVTADGLDRPGLTRDPGVHRAAGGSGDLPEDLEVDVDGVDRAGRRCLGAAIAAEPGGADGLHEQAA